MEGRGPDRACAEGLLAPPITLQHLQHHVHDVLVAGISALHREGLSRRSPGCPLLPVSHQQHFQHLIEPLLLHPRHPPTGGLEPASGTSASSSSPSPGDYAALPRDFPPGRLLATGATHRHALSPGQPGHAAVANQSSGAGESGVALHPGGARIPAGAAVAGFSADALLRGRGVQRRVRGRTRRGRGAPGRGGPGSAAGCGAGRRERRTHLSLGPRLARLALRAQGSPVTRSGARGTRRSPGRPRAARSPSRLSRPGGRPLPGRPADGEAGA